MVVIVSERDYEGILFATFVCAQLLGSKSGNFLSCSTSGNICSSNICIKLHLMVVNRLERRGDFSRHTCCVLWTLMWMMKCLF